MIYLIIIAISGVDDKVNICDVTKVLVNNLIG